MKSISSLLHSVAFHARVITSRRTTSSGALTPEKIESLRQKMAFLAEEHKANSPPFSLPALSEEDFIKQIEQENKKFDKAVEDQVAGEKFAQEVVEAVRKKKLDSK